MGNEELDILENIKKIKFDVEECKTKYRKPNDKLDIMAVTKTVPYNLVNLCVENGFTLLGENRVQEFLQKKQYYSKDAIIHFIGHLQKNKVKRIVNQVSMIQSVDSLDLAKEINRLSESFSIVTKILLEINIGKEENKFGFFDDQITEALQLISLMKNISVEGLMCIPPKENSEKYFSKMNEVFIDIKDKNIDNINMSILSMGMSSDYKYAIKYGSNLLRIGTAIFGCRK